MAKAGSLKLDFMAKSIGIHFFDFEDMFRSYRDNENLKKHFGHIDTLKEDVLLTPTDESLNKFQKFTGDWQTVI